jgi:hypothetical protein
VQLAECVPEALSSTDTGIAYHIQVAPALHTEESVQTAERKVWGLTIASASGLARVGANCIMGKIERLI